MADSSQGRNPVEALAEEFLERHRRGERPSLTEYSRRHPELADEIRGLFPALLVMEEVRPAADRPLSPSAALDTDIEQPTRLGDFRIIREVGRGGMGVVYEAEQVSLGRRVALKVLPKQTLLDSKHAKRFEREARAAAKLHHTNIVPVFGVGTQEGLHYYVMQFIHGLGLDEVLVELRRLREASEFPHATAEQQIASVVAAGAAEKAAVGVQALACGGQPEGGTPTGRDVSAFSVAQSLVSGQFERTLIVESGEESADSGQPSAVSDQPSGTSTPTLPATTLHSPHSTLHTPPDTAVGRLSETAAGSGAYALPGQSEAHRKAHSRSVYWQSVARIGVQAAEALQYAHDQGVIHRDVKPGNLLLDTRGCVWVTDFGLAKAADQQDLTHTGDVLGTLRYMAPEQFDGKADARSDVYALGLTLYELLALQPGFDEKDRHKLIRQVTTGAPARLRTVDAHIPRDLETIVHKAIERDPAQRYQTAGELAADLQRYLGDEPIRARRISPVTRFARWCKRHPGVAGLTTTIAVLLAVAAAVSSVAAVRFEGLAAEKGRLVVQANSDKAAAQAAQKDAEVARDHEKELREEAETQTQRANTNFALARRAVNKYLDDVTETALLSAPGLQPLREELLKAALTFYTEFTQEQTDDPTLLIELADAQYRLAVIHRELGNTDALRTAGRESMRLFERLREQGHDDLEVQVGLARVYSLGGRQDQTEQLCKSILETNPKHAETRALLGETYNTLANREANANRFDTALAYHQQAFELREALAHESPDNAGYLAQLGATMNNLGYLLAKQRNASLALDMFERSVPYSAQAYKLQPHSVLWGEWLCNGVRNCAYKQKETGATDAARKSFERLVTLRRELALRNQAVVRLQAAHYQACLERGRFEQELGDDAESLRSMREARRVLELIPHDTALQLAELGLMFVSLSRPVEGDPAETAYDADERAKFADQAVSTLKQAIDAGYRDLKKLQQDKLLDPLREREDFRALLADLEKTLEAEKLAADPAGTDEQQLANQRKAADIVRMLLDDQPAELRHRKTLAGVLHSIGVIQTGLKRFEEAERSLNEALQLRQALRTEQPDDPLIAIDEVATRVAIGQLDWERARFPEGHWTWQDCSKDLQEIGASHRDNQTLQQRITVEERTICNGYGRYGLWPLAGPFVRRSVEFRRVSSDFQAAEFSALLLLPENAAAADEYLAALAAAPPHTEMERETFRITHLVRTAAMARSDVIPSEDLIARARDALKKRDDGVWWKIVLAIALYRADVLQEAHDVIAPVDEIGSHVFARPQSLFVKSFVASALGNDSEARANLSRGETLYKQACVESLTYPAVNSLGLPTINWHELIQLQAQRREALRLIQGKEPPDDPWQHLIQARGYRLIGEDEQAEAELAASVAAAPDDSEVWIARAQLVAGWDTAERTAETDLKRAKELAPNDPLPLIHSGRWYAERGEHDKADADFAKAASLTPNELNRFLEAGWWVVGPYPPELKEFCPPEINPDPSQAVYTIDPKSGLSEQPVAWQHAPTGDWGRIAAPASWGSASAYALVCVWSPEECTRSILIHDSESPAAAWVNGQRLDPPVADGIGWLAGWRHWKHAPITLRPGRNTILVKFRADKPVQVTLSDSPVVSGFELFKFGCFQRAAEVLHDVIADRSDMWIVSNGGFAALTAGDVELYRKFVVRQSGNFRADGPAGDGIVSTELLAIAPAEHSDPAAIEKSLARWYPRDLDAMQPWQLRIAAWAHYRLGKWQDVIDTLAKAPNEVLATPVLAMAHHQLGNASEARRALDRADEVFERSVANFLGNGGPETLWLLYPTFREAHELIDGDAVDIDIRFDEFLEERARLWDARDPTISAFDDAVRNAPADANAYMARGRRLAELGRFAEAEADFDKAVALAPDDHVVAAARAAFLAERGDVPRAADAFWAAVQAGNAKDWTNIGRIVEYELSQHEAVLAELLRRFPQNAGLNRIRGESLARRGLWAEARQSYRAGDRYWLHESCNAALSLLLGDEAGYEQACQRQPPLLRENPRGAPELFGARQVEIRGLRPSDPAGAAELLRLLQEESAGAGEWRQPLFARGLARYRNGDFEGAIKALGKAQQPHSDWQRDAFLWPVLAMAHWQLGRHDEARKWLARSETWIDLTHQAVDIPLSVGPQNTVHDWWLYAHVLHFEAKGLIDGPDASQEALQLLATRAATRTREAPEKRLRDSLARAEAAWEGAIKAAPADPMPLIHHAHWYVERGEHEKADAEFARAAALTDQLNPFLEAGWWVAGPIPGPVDEQQPRPGEGFPTLDRPIAGSDGKTLFQWRPVTTGDFGLVDFSTSTPAGTNYAIGYLYADRERQETLLLGAHGKARVWLNGQEIGRSDRPGNSEFANLSRLTAALQPGRNVVLVKHWPHQETDPGRVFYLRFPEGDLDRGIDYLDAGLYADASELLERGLQRPPPISTWPWTCAVSALRAAGIEGDRYQRLTERLVARYGDGANKFGARTVVVAGGLTPEVVVPHDRLVQLAEEQLILEPADVGRVYEMALALYRAGRFEEARDRLLNDGKMEANQFCWSLLSLIHERLGDRATATQWLERAQEWYEQNLEGLSASTQQKPGHWEEFCVLFREAKSVIEGRPLTDDPRLHLWRARSWASFGEFEKAERELAAAADLAPRDPDVWLAIARLRGEWDELATVTEAALSKAIELGGDDPLPWIHRGRWYAERGEHEKSDDDFAKAASLTPNELNKFLEAGWWVVGPYPKELMEYCPPELDPDPSVPVHVIDPQSGLSEGAVRWRNVRAGELGAVDLQPVLNAGHLSVYALTYVYSPDERTATLRVGGDDAVRLWVNGELVHQTQAPRTWAFDLDRVAVTLRPGRNTLLAKISQTTGPHLLNVRLADGPLDRAFALAEFGLWHEAAQEMRRANPEGIRDAWLAVRFAELLLGAGDGDGYRRHCAWIIEQFHTPASSFDAIHVAWACSLAPDAMPDGEWLVRVAQQGHGPERRHEELYRTAVLARALLRAGRFDEAVERLAALADWRNPVSDVVLAIAHHHRGDAEAAHESLDKARSWYDLATNTALGESVYRRPHHHWNEFVDFQILYPEARALIDGATDVDDRNAVELLARARDEWSRRDAPTADFDQVLRIVPDQPRHWLARGWRLAQLGRFDEADADFNQAVQLAPNDVQVAASRTLFLADRGNVLRAADEFHRIYRIGFGNAYPKLGFDIESRLATQAELMTELLRRQPENAALHRLLGDAFAFQGRWDEARQSYTTGTPYWSHEFSAAAISALLDDADGFQSALERVEPLFRRDGNLNEGDILFHHSWMQALSPCAQDQADERVLALQTAIDANQWEHFRSALGIAQYRAGQYQAAVENLSRDAALASTWHLQARAWPVLAMAHWQLGNHDTARQYLDRTANYLTLTHRASRQFQTAGGAGLYPPWWLAIHALQREARTLIDGPEAAAAELAALTTVPDGVATSRLTADQRVKGYLDRAIEVAPDDPLPLIHRGRWYAERGEQEQADADFSKAASLTPNELNKFLEAGWWVVGPYPPTLDEFCPPEVDPDPSQPVSVIDSRTGLSNEPVKWRDIRSDGLGRLPLAGIAGVQGNSSVYALAQVYSPDDRTTTLWLESRQSIRCWVNGEPQVSPSAPAIYNNGLDQGNLFIPIALRQGRNALLLKIGAQGTAPWHNFVARLGDHPFFRGLQLTRFGLLGEAAAALEEAHRRGQPTPRDLSGANALSVRDTETYRRIAADLFQDVNVRSTPPQLFNAARYCASSPLGADESARLLEWIQTWVRAAQPPADSWQWREVARVYCRAGQWQDALDVLTRSCERDAHAWPIFAMACHHLGRADEAQHWLQKCDERFHHVIQEFRGNGTEYVMIFYPAFREACELIAGDVTRVDAEFDALLEQRRQLWQARDPATADFDDAIRNAVWPAPHLYVARGRRLAELGRIDDAEADFNKAVELAPADPHGLTARAVFYADHGKSDEAAADFRGALGMLKVGPVRADWEVRRIYLEIARRDDVLDRLEALRPNDGHPRMFRMILRTRDGDLDAAGADAERLKQYGGLRVTSAAVALLRGDEQMFADLLASRGALDPREQARLLALVPADASLAAELLEIAQENWNDPANRWHRRWLGEAQFRAGRHAEAVATLEDSQDPVFDWQCDGCYWPLLAMAHHRLGQIDAARKYLEMTSHLLELYRRMSPAQFVEVMGRAGANPRSWLETVVYHREALQLIEGAPAAAALQQEGRFAEAAAAWQAVLGVVPNDPAHWLQLAECRLRVGEFNGAISACSRSAEVAGAGSGRATALYRRGMLRMIRGELTPALEDLTTAIELSAAGPPSRPVAQNGEQQRCVAWLLLGDLESYRRRCRELLAEHHESTDPARLNVIVGCCKQHPVAADDWSEIVEIAERCARLGPAKPEYRRNLFIALCRAGRPDEALERVPELATEDGLGSQLALALCEVQLGHVERARELLAACDAQLSTEFTYWTAEMRRRADEVRQLINAAAPPPEQGTDTAKGGVSVP